jgi:hypothetical protein
MSHKIAKKARRLAREVGADIGPVDDSHYVEWKPVKKAGVATERPQQRLMPGSFRSIVKQLKEKLS